MTTLEQARRRIRHRAYRAPHDKAQVGYPGVQLWRRYPALIDRMPYALSKQFIETGSTLSAGQENILVLERA